MNLLKDKNFNDIKRAMKESHVIILLLILVFVGLGATGFSVIKNSFKETDISSSPLVSPTPQDEGLLFKQEFQTNEITKTEVKTTPQKTVKQYRAFPGNLSSEELINKQAIIETNKGKIIFEVYPEATKAASNFIFLSRDGFYDNLTFHRVEPRFVIQGGDPLGNGTGDPGYKFEDEPVTRKYDKGIVAMANSGSNTNGSQFFIMLEDTPNLPPKYTIFGKVIEGIDVVENIKVGDVMKKVTIETKLNP